MSRRRERVFLGLGSNVGNRLFYLKEALRKITYLPGTKITTSSSIYETTPVGPVNQSDYLNLVAEVFTSSSPERFLKSIQKIEEDLGRERRVRWGPRTIDIDILYWGKRVISKKTLRIPHPEIERRRFVLEPLNEIASDFKAPPEFLTICELLENCRDEDAVELHLPKDQLCTQLRREVNT